MSWLAGKAELPDHCCHKNLEFLFEIMQVMVSGSISYLTS
jgi:hypothetical protein